MSAPFEKTGKERTVHIMQGEFHVSDDSDVVLATILGSCVAICLYDPVAGVGGMNHFLLPGDAAKDPPNVIYGFHVMNLLLDAMRDRGADRRQLHAKVFGGARMINGVTDIGRLNADAALSLLYRKNIKCVGQSLGGENARRIRFWPTTGLVRQKFLGDARRMEVG